MKTLYFIIISGVFILGYFNSFGQDYPQKIKLSEIEILDKKIDSLLHVVIKKTKDTFKNRNECYILLSVAEQNPDYTVTIVIQSKRVLNYLYHSEGLPILGFCMVEDQYVLIMNEFHNQKMKFSRVEKTFVFPEEQRKYRQKNKIPPPPPMFDPAIFEFLITKNGNAILLDK